MAKDPAPAGSFQHVLCLRNDALFGHANRREQAQHQASRGLAGEQGFIGVMQGLRLGLLHAFLQPGHEQVEVNIRLLA